MAVYKSCFKNLNGNFANMMNSRCNIFFSHKKKIGTMRLY